MRKLAIFAGAFSAGIFLAQYLLPIHWLLPGAWIALAAALSGLLLPGLWRKRCVLIGVGLALALGYNWLYVRQVQRPMEDLAGQTGTVVMTVCAQPTGHGLRRQGDSRTGRTGREKRSTTEIPLY